MKILHLESLHHLLYRDVYSEKFDNLTQGLVIETNENKCPNSTCRVHKGNVFIKSHLLENIKPLIISLFTEDNPKCDNSFFKSLGDAYIVNTPRYGVFKEQPALTEYQLAENEGKGIAFY